MTAETVLRSASRAELPVIDMAPLLSGDEAGQRAVCTTTGFFYIANHGIPAAQVAHILAEAKRFFDEPLALKQSVGLHTNKIFRGYDGFGGQALDLATGADFKESMYMGVDLPPDHPLVRAGTPNHGANPWPDWLPGWRQSVLDYFAAMERLSRRLLGGIALSLDLPADHFDFCLDEHMSAVRLLHYPPHPTADPAREVGCGAHTDWGALTVLAQDETGGLEIRLPSGEWIAAPPIPGTFIINIGDMLARWTNDLYTSTPHRVLNRSTRDRYSTAFFFDPNYHTRVECLPTCRSADRPPRYAPTTAGEHIIEMYRKTYRLAS